MSFIGRVSERINNIIKSRKRLFWCIGALAAAAVAAVCGVKLVRLTVDRAEDKKTYEEAAATYVSVSPRTDPESLEEKTDDDAVLISDTIENTEEDVNSEDEPVSDEWYNRIAVDLKALRELNPDIVGWIWFEDGNTVNYPVLYSGDDTYLNTDYKGEGSKAGAIYIEPYNKPDFSDAHTLIYGHNMKDGSMFGVLKKYRTVEDYMEGHDLFQIVTEEKIYRYKIFHYKNVKAAKSEVYKVFRRAGEEYLDFIGDELEYRGIYDTEGDLISPDHVITLSTCSYSDNVRFVVSAVRIDEHEITE